ncbi:cellular tumor antigen p53-like [Dendronephthya gigantea]|uniref:cellular tumor antigen p53-like n=1 Tax=Dendronephthya gigantea TaxID=151771 RepID=UPI00106CD17C|nr:cellular tumor antigen p53-like [Dendronephthya gigantea]
MMDSEDLEDFMKNFDDDVFLPFDTSNSVQLRSGMKAHSDDPMTSCSINEDSSFMPPEVIADYQHNIPSTAEMVGNYNFHVELGNQSKRVANPEWVYKNNKLYIKAGTLCPIIFSASSCIPQPCNIRIMPVFKNPEDVRDIVRCCPNHTMDNVDKTSFSSVKHFIRCENEQVLYKECPMTGRHYLSIPFNASQRDTHSKTVSTHELLSFVCNNSCVGLNRRPIQIIFEMTHGQSIMGRGLLEVRVCACPGRDSNLDEKTQKQPFRRKRRMPNSDETTVDRLYFEEPPFLTPINMPTTSENNETPPKKKKTAGENFYLKINGRQNFVIMERIAKALELFTSMEKRFFSKNFPFQVLEQIQRRSNECPEYPEADSTVYRRNLTHENMSFNNTHQTIPSPNIGIPAQWADSTQQHSIQNQAATTSQNMQISYSNHTVQRTLVT